MAEPITNVLGTVAIKHCGEYDASMIYEKLNVVTYQGSSYCAKGPTQGNLPTNTTYWDLIAEKGDKGDTGDEGYTPVKGTDYYTAADKAELENTLSSDVTTEVTGQLSTLTSATPLAVNSTSAMTDTTRIYVNTTDGHWYWYDGNDWQDGGVYQSTGISDESISVYMLENSLQSQYIKHYENIPFSYENDGYIAISNNKISVNSNVNYQYAEVSLTKDSIYEFSGFSEYSVLGIIIADEDDNVVYKLDTDASVINNNNLIFRANKSGLTAYIGQQKAVTSSFTNFAKNNNTLSKINFVVPNLNNVINPLSKLKTISGYLLDLGKTYNVIPIMNSSGTGKVEVYKVSKGSKYHIKGYNYGNSPAYLITNNKFEIKYSSAIDWEGVYPSYEIIEEDYDVLEDGYLLTSIFSTYAPEIKLINDINNSPYKNKKWYPIGDSLTDFITLGSDKNYVNYVSDRLNIPFDNKGVSGTGYWRGHTSNNAFYQRVQNLTGTPDIITLFGSFNDLGTEDGVSGGSILGTKDDTTNATIGGCINLTLDTLIANFPNAVIGIITPTPWSGQVPTNQYSERYVQLLRDIAYKRSIPLLDLFTCSNLYPWDNTFKGLFYRNSDGVHPNTLGHKKISGQIADFITRVLY